MLMLGLLPHHLVQVILDDYVRIDLCTASRLDVACCSRCMRKDMLVILSAVTSLKKLNCGLQIDKDISKKYLSSYLRWLASRKVAVSQLLVDPCCTARAVEELKTSKLSLTNIRSVRFVYEGDTVLSTFGQSVVAFLGMFPALTEINCADLNAMGDDVFTEFKHLKCPLETLNLEECNRISSDCVLEVVSCFSDSLLSLTCDALDNSGLSLLPYAKLRKLKHFSMHCGLLSHSIALEEFCASAKALEELHLTGDCPAINNYSVKRIAQSCRGLKTIAFSSEMLPDLDSLQDIVDSCPDIGRIRYPDMDITNSGGKRVCEHFCFDVCFEDEIKRICHGLSALGISLRRAFIYGKKQYGTEKSIRLVTETFGEGIEIIMFYHFEDVDEILYALALCPNLLSLKFADCRSLTDKLLVELHTHCPKLTTFCIADASLITASALLLALDQFKNNPMVELTFNRCEQISIGTLKTIACMFPNKVMGTYLDLLKPDRVKGIEVANSDGSLVTTTAAAAEYSKGIKQQAQAKQSFDPTPGSVRKSKHSKPKNNAEVFYKRRKRKQQQKLQMEAALAVQTLQPTHAL